MPDLQKRVGQNMAQLRKMRRLTQAEVAELLGVEPDYVWRIERGRENLTLLSLSRLAAVLGVDPALLVQRGETEKK